EAEEAEKRSAIRLRVLTEASRALFEAKLDPREILKTVCEQVGKQVRDSCTIHLVNHETRMLDLAASYHVRPEVLISIQRTLKATPVPLGEGLLGGVAATGKPVYIPVIPLEQFLAVSKPEYREHHEKYPSGSLMVVPVRVSDRIVGTLTASRDQGSPAFTG